jgi:hypothetical protein
MWLVAFISIDNEPDADQSVRMVDTAGKAEPARKRITTLDRGGDALGVERGGHHCFRVLAPDIFLRLERKYAEHLGVIACTQPWALSARVRRCETPHSASQPIACPPKRSGWVMRIRPASRKTATDPAGIMRAASASAARARKAGCRASARAYIRRCLCRVLWQR